MAVAPAATSARPAVTTMEAAAEVPERPAASANGTVRPSAIPMMMSRTSSLDLKCFSSWTGVLMFTAAEEAEVEEGTKGEEEQRFMVAMYMYVCMYVYGLLSLSQNGMDGPLSTVCLVSRYMHMHVYMVLYCV